MAHTGSFTLEVCMVDSQDVEVEETIKRVYTRPFMVIL